MEKAEIVELLRSLRSQALTPEGVPLFGSHQLDAHWSLAFASDQAPEPWEIYRACTLVARLPRTDFFIAHREEIQEAIRPHATWALLRDHALPKWALEDAMTLEERNSYGHPGNVQFCDLSKGGWATVDVRRVNWFDGREALREHHLKSKEDIRASAMKELGYRRRKAQEDPTPRHLSDLESYEKFCQGQLLTNLQEWDVRKEKYLAWLTKVESTPDFKKVMFQILRQGENEVRASHGVPSIGESWVSETELLYRVRKLLPDHDVVAHGQPKWLGRQHLDIWIPALSIAIEYHGIQHFEVVDFFGGADGLAKNQARDQRKRALCSGNGMHLIEIAYDQEPDDATLLDLILPRSLSASAIATSDPG